MVRNNEHMFEITNMSPLGMSILTMLARSPEQEYYVREIAKKIDASVSGCYTALCNLEVEKLVVARTSGKNKYFKVNPDNIGIRFFKVFVSIQELSGVMEKLRDITVKIILFGSCARGEDVLDSDVDLLVVTEDTKTVKDLVPKKIGERKLKPIIIKPSQLIQMKEKDNAFYNEVHEGIALWRRTDE